MFYITVLVLLSAVSYLSAKSLFVKSGIKREAAFAGLESEFARLSAEFKKIKDENLVLESNVAETVALYSITKDISRQIDEDKIFVIFKERINNYIKITDCRLLDKREGLKSDKDCICIPLIINRDTSRYLIARGVEENNKKRFKILAQQLLIMLRRSSLYSKIQEVAIMDGLTQVFGRRHFLERLKEEIKRSRKFKYRFSFLMVDIDRFKGFNDKYGHLVGDAILREISKTIRDTLRQIDFVGRYGGEELSIVLPETDKEQALLAAERIRREIELKNIKVYDEQLKVTISAGISTFPDDAGDSSLLIEAADVALYLAKAKGRNKVCAYQK